VLEFVPDTVYRISKHYSKAGQRMPSIYVKLYTYQVGPRHAVLISTKQISGPVYVPDVQFGKLHDSAAKPLDSRRSWKFNRMLLPR
jgi:hypothetical protein